MTVAIGFFDGVHLGHQAILAGADVALTFENHPLSFLAPERAPRLIMSWEERAKAIQALGVLVTAIDFDAEIANLSPVDFLQRLRNYAAVWSEYLKIPAEPLQIRCGANWRFGKGGAGDAAFACAHGIETTVVPYAVYKDEPVSSTRVRAALEAGAIEDAAAMLGRPYQISGEVFAGKGKGKVLGYPTVNVRPPYRPSRGRRPTQPLGRVSSPVASAVCLPLGVYAVDVGGVKAIANYGRAPTFKDAAWTDPVWEIHFLPPPPALDTSSLAFSVLNFIRPERQFASLEELQRQIALDCATIGA